MAERKDGKLDPQPLTDLSLHANTPKINPSEKGTVPFSRAQKEE
jgi:hypothetical protein